VSLNEERRLFLAAKIERERVIAATRKFEGRIQEMREEQARCEAEHLKAEHAQPAAKQDNREQEQWEMNSFGYSRFGGANSGSQSDFSSRGTPIWSPPPPDFGHAMGDRPRPTLTHEEEDWKRDHLQSEYPRLRLMRRELQKRRLQARQGDQTPGSMVEPTHPRQPDQAMASERMRQVLAFPPARNRTRSHWATLKRRRNASMV
jgi:hypothetical protein